MRPLRRTVGSALRARPTVRVGAAVAAILAVAVSGLLTGAGSASTAVQAPANLTPPIVSGLQVGQTITATPGTWSGDTPMSYEYQWVRSEPGGNWAPIPEAKGSSYTVTPADLGHNLFVQVKALNDGGHAWGSSAPTSHVTAATASDTQALPGGQTSVAIENVVLPDRLVVQSATFGPARLAPGGAVTAQIQILDALEHPVRGAVVKVVGLPFGAVQPLQSTTTGADGVAQVTISASAKLASMGAKAIALSIRATKPGGSILAGVTGSRLVKLPVG